jgi:hypothetical protein
MATFVVLGLLERWYRTQGCRPTLVDSKDMWSIQRDRATAGGKKTIVFVGASRSLLAISTETVRELLPDYTVVQLSVDATGDAWETLEDLSADKDFCGVVVYAHQGIPPGASTRTVGQKDWVKYYHGEYSFSRMLNCQIGTWLRSQFVVMDPYLSLKRVVASYISEKRLPRPRYIVVKADRSIDADYALTNAQAMRESRIRQHYQFFRKTKPITYESWERLAQKSEKAVKEIEAHGGSVVYVRYPMGKEPWEFQERLYPKAKYWDVFAKKSAADMIHFKDVDGMSGYNLPDASHLDVRDKRAFTLALMRELERRGLVPKLAEPSLPTGM